MPGRAILVDMRADLHQHVWTAPLLRALQARDRLPFVRRHGRATVVHSAGELPYRIDVAAHSAAARRATLHADGVQRAAVALSSPIGIEVLEPAAASELISAHLDGVLALGPEFLAWGPVPVQSPDGRDVDRVLSRGCVGVSLPAGALSGPAAVEFLGPVLDRVQARDVPLFVHPGPGVTVRSDGDAHGLGAEIEAPAGEPPWWRALTEYVTQMQTAWLIFQTTGRPAYPRVRIVYAMLAGGAPLLAERLALRGGPQLNLTEPRTFYDTSGSGTQLRAAVEQLVGRDQLVYGSDRPVVEPSLTGGDLELMCNAGQLLGHGS